MLVSIYLCTIVTLQDPSVGSDLCPGMYVAIKSAKYHERPLIGKVCDTDGGMVEIEQMVGMYSGLWKQWKGREGGKTVVFTEKICKEDIIYTNITFTPGKRLTPATIKALKPLYD